MSFSFLGLFGVVGRRQTEPRGTSSANHRHGKEEKGNVRTSTRSDDDDDDGVGGRETGGKVSCIRRREIDRSIERTSLIENELARVQFFRRVLGRRRRDAESWC